MSEDPKKAMRFLMAPFIRTFDPDGDGVKVVLVRQDNSLLTHSEAEELIEKIKAGYRELSEAEIAEVNAAAGWRRQ